MNKYCFNITEHIERSTEVIVFADSLEDAEGIIEASYDKGTIDFSHPTEEDFSIEYETDCCLEDETFDEEQYSDIGMQVLSGNWTNDIINAVDTALLKYGCDVISVDYNEETGMIDINKCFGNSSDVYQASVADRDDVDIKKLIQFLDNRGVGHCGI